MSFSHTIRILRDNANLSQQEVAAAVGIARATYIGLENARREPNLTEITKLAEYYQVAPSDLINGGVVVNEAPVVPYAFEERDEVTPREISPEIKPEKLREVLLYVLEKVGAKPNVGETVLYKLLYFIDFDFYEKTGRSVTGLTYIRNHYGPTPALQFKDVVEGMKQHNELEVIETRFFNNTQRKYLPVKRSELRELTAKELAHIDETLARLSDKNASELSDLSHHDTPWVVAKPGKPIAYRDVFYRTARTSIAEPDDEL